MLLAPRQWIILTVESENKIYRRTAFIKWITIKHTPFSIFFFSFDFTFSQNSLGLFKCVSLLFELENAEGGRTPLAVFFYSVPSRYLQCRQGGSLFLFSFFFFFFAMGWCWGYSNQTVHAVGGYPLRRDNQHNSLKLLESCAGFYLLRMTNLLASSWPPSIQERSSCGGGPLVY